MNKKDCTYIVLFIFIVAMMRGCSGETIKEEIIHDTIPFLTPVHDTIYRDSTRIVRIPIESVDISEDDSCFILETDVKHYRDSLYEAWVSGINPNLDSIHVFSKTTVRTITREVPKYVTLSAPKPKTLQFGGFVSGQSSFDINHLNLQAGADLQIKNLDVKIGYNLGEYSYPFVGLEYRFR